MTDVSKTLAELKARFADNTRESVTPQDMRDLLESLTNPVFRSGLRSPMYARISMMLANSIPVEDRPQLNASGGGWSAALPLLAGGQTHANPVYSHDNGGWFAAGNSFSLLGSDPDASWAVDIPTGTAAMLPPGLYFASVGCGLTAPVTIDVSNMIAVFFDQAMYDSVGAGSIPDNEPFYYDGYYNWNTLFEAPDSYSASLAGSTQYVTSLNMVVNDSDVAKPFFAGINQRRSSSHQPIISFYNIRIHQIIDGRG